MANRRGPWVRRGVIGVATAGCLALAGVVTIWWMSNRRLARRYEVEPITLPASIDTARGEHLVTSVTICAHCHGPDLGGQIMADNPVLRVAAPNLTSGHGGLGATLSDADIERAVRHGIRPDGTPLLVMPADAYASLSDADLAAIIAYLRSRPAVHREVPSSRLTLMGRMLLVSGKVDEIPAERIRPAAGLAETPLEPLALGSYLTEVAGCSFCHQRDFGGRSVPIGPPGSPVIPAINRLALAGWSERDFATALRTGRRPDGRELVKFMPWKYFAGMTDAEVHAIWIYLQTRPAAPAPSQAPSENRIPQRRR